MKTILVVTWLFLVTVSTSLSQVHSTTLNSDDNRTTTFAMVRDTLTGTTWKGYFLKKLNQDYILEILNYSTSKFLYVALRRADTTALTNHIASYVEIPPAPSAGSWTSRVIPHVYASRDTIWVKGDSAVVFTLTKW